MALVWLEGFEMCQIAALFPRKYPVTSITTSSITGSTGWQGSGNALTNSGATLGFDVTTGALVGSVENAWVLGWAWMLGDTAGLSTSQTAFPSVILADGVGSQLQFEMVAYNETKAGGNGWRLQVRRGSTVLGTSDKIFKQEKWYYIEVKATIHPSTGSFAMRWHTQFSSSPTTDTFQGASLTGLNTANQGTAGADRVRLKLNSAPLTSSSDEIQMDDLYVLAGSGGLHDYLGRQYIEGVLPNANGNQLDWTLAGGAANLTAAWAEAGTTQSGPGDDSRVQSDVLNQIELADYAPVAVLRLTDIKGVLLHTQSRMDTSGSRTFCHRIRKTTGSPVEVDGLTFTCTSTAEQGNSEVFENDPNTAAAWVKADFNAVQFGVKLKT
jgi:hypothetical protein